MEFTFLLGLCQLLPLSAGSYLLPLLLLVPEGSHFPFSDSNSLASGACPGTGRVNLWGLQLLLLPPTVTSYLQRLMTSRPWFSSLNNKDESYKPSVVNEDLKAQQLKRLRQENGTPEVHLADRASSRPAEAAKEDTIPK